VDGKRQNPFGNHHGETFEIESASMSLKNALVGDFCIQPNNIVNKSRTFV